MAHDKTERHVMFAAIFMMMFFFGVTLLVSSVVRASLGPDSIASAATFRTKCAMCHGQDGSGSLVGQSISVPDLRSPVAQKLSDAQLARIISDGKGRMPSFKNSLSEAQIHGLVTYVRLLHHPVLFQRGREGTL